MRPTRLAPAALLMLLVGCSRPTSEATADNSLERLEQEVAQERQAGHEYVPKVVGRIDDPAAPAADILRQVPEVADIEVLVGDPRPTGRIVHVRDWHFVPRDLCALG